MAKMTSTFSHMVLSLGCITIVAAAALGGVYLLTKDTIEVQKAAKQQAAISAVLPEHDAIAEAEEVNGLNIYRATLNGEYVGAAVESHADGFGGVQKIMVGFDKEGKIVDYQVLEQQETPGLGTHIVEWFKNADKPGQNIVGRQATGTFTVKKDGGDVDAITAATISSRAFLKAINEAYNAFANVGSNTDATSGATKQENIKDTTTVANDTIANEEMEATNE